MFNLCTIHFLILYICISPEKFLEFPLCSVIISTRSEFNLCIMVFTFKDIT